MKALLAAAMFVSLIAVIYCQTPQCISDYYINNPSVTANVAQNCGHLLDDVR